MNSEARLTAPRADATGRHSSWRPLRGLRGRLLLLVGLATIPAIQGVVYHAIDQRDQLLDMARRDVAGTLDDILVAAHLRIRGTEEILTTLASVPEVIGTDAKACNQFLAKLHRKHKTFINLGVIQPDGAVTCSALPMAAPVNAADREYFKRAMTTRTFVAGGFQVGRISREAVLVFAYPALDDRGAVRVVIFAALPLTWMQEELTHARVPAGSVLNVIDANNRLLARFPPEKTWLGKRFDDAPLVKAVRKALGRGTAEVEGLDGVRRLFAFMPLPGVSHEREVVVSVGIPIDAAYAPVHKSAIVHTALVALMAGLVLAIAWWGGNVFILRQVRALQHASRSLAQGDLAARARLIGQQGELADLARAFNDMADEIEKRAREAEDHLERIRRLSRIYSVLSSINATILRSRDRDQLLQEACRIAVESGGLYFARVFVVDPESQAVMHVAHAGADADALRQLDSRLPDNCPLPPEIMRRVFDEGTHHIMNCLADPDTFPPLREMAATLGCGSAGVFPLHVGDRITGAIAFCAKEKGWFDEEEVRLLREVAGDVSLGLEYAAQADKVQELTFYDPVTGLPNRSLFEDRVTQSVARAKYRGRVVAVVALEVSDLQVIIDTVGYHAGDRILQQIAQHVGQHLRDGDATSRLVGNALGIMLADVAARDDVADVLETLLRTLPRELTINGDEVRFAVEGGIAIFPDDGALAPALVARALFAAHTSGKDPGVPYRYYSREIDQQVRALRQIEADLRHSVERGQLHLVFQPIVDLQTSRIYGAETLVRWSHPERGSVPPAEFIPIAEETRSIVPIGEWILRTAAAAAREWGIDKGLPVRVGVNVSVVQLQEQDFVQQVDRILEEVRLDPRLAPLGIEITESALMKNVGNVIASLGQLKQRGLSIYIDDFGTGYSSFSYLRRLPIDGVKIDRAFITDIATNPVDADIARSIIALAHSLGLKVVAEGIETAEQAEILRLFRCDFGQGYHFSYPVPANEFESMLKVRT